MCGPPHHCSSKVSENSAFPGATQSVRRLFGAANSVTTERGDYGPHRIGIGVVGLDGVLKA